MSADFQRWAVVGPNDDTGLGRMAIDIVAVLGLGRHLVLPSERFFTRPFVPGRDVSLTREDDDARVREALAGLDGLICIERTWNPRLVPAARAMRLAIVCVPMWEWFHRSDPDWKLCHRFFCPHAFAAEMLRSVGFANTVVVPWALDLARLPARQLRPGPARVFFHNAGWVDDDDRKGTAETIRAFERVPDPELRLIVRAQAKLPVSTRDPRIDLRVGNLAASDELYAEGDLAIQPSKMEGLGFMVLEPVCSGLPVITLDYPPMSTFVRQPECRVRARWWKRRAFATQWIRQAHLRLPDERDLARRIAWAAAHDVSAVGRDNRAWAETEFSREHLRRIWAEALGACLPLR